jgi:hypothetical protein
VLALFAGLATADVVGGGAQLTCSTNVAVTPALRGEGFTEQTGDVTITCTGGAAPVAGAVVPLINFTVFYNTNVTSRLFNSNGTSEALLLIDEPGSGLQGDGPNQPQLLCTNQFSGCPAWVNTPVGGVPYSAVASAAGSGRAPNVYQGIVSGNSVTFFGVPVLPPTSTGSRVFRITNVRVNAQPLNNGSASGSPVQASVSTSPAGALTITQPFLNVGFVSPSLTVSNDNIGNLNQCASQTRTTVSTISFKENFGTAFKVRLNPGAVDTQYIAQLGLVTNPAGSLNATSQSIPGAIYNSESNFVFPTPSGTAGLADFGTRLKATFNAIPSGTRIFVSTSNVNNANVAATAPTVIGGTQQTSYAQLVSSETAADSIGASGVLPSLDTSSTSDSGTLGKGTLKEVSLSNGTGTAVWEVLNTNPNSNETFKFGVYVTYSSNTATNTPLPGPASVTLSYAPTSTSSTASTGVIPRFGVGTTPGTIFNIVICRTILLYPFVTAQAGFDTGISIANTTVDPFGTAAQTGACTLNWYGGTTAAPNTPPAASSTGTIAAGAVFANAVSVLAPTFQGYMFAVCNFQFAHGFATVGDVGLRNLMTTYLAIVLNDPGTTTGGRSPAATGVPGSSGPEVGAH